MSLSWDENVSFNVISYKHNINHYVLFPGHMEDRGEVGGPWSPRAQCPEINIKGISNQTQGKLELML